jgi:hypothetical protein
LHKDYDRNIPVANKSLVVTSRGLANRKVTLTLTLTIVVSESEDCWGSVAVSWYLKSETVRKPTEEGEHPPLEAATKQRQ